MDELLKYQDLAQKILLRLDSELPPQYRDKIGEFKNLCDKNLYRAGYVLLDDLRRKDDWHPSLQLEGLIKHFQMVF